MSVVAIIGAQWGDEGKGKIVDHLAEKVALTIRFSGGPNAGHTVVNQFGEFRLHLVPSGIFYPQALCLIGSGVVISPPVLLEELAQLELNGIDTSRLIISDRAHLIMPYHTLFDRLEEEARGKQALGTTRTGVGPAYTDKVARLGIRAGDLLDRERLYQRLDFVLKQKNAILTKIYSASPLSLNEVYRQCCQWGEQLSPFIKPIEPIIQQVSEREENILLEGAQGALLDIDFGTYPYVTSTSTTAGGACIGTGITPTKISHIIGIFKAYTTRVGGGPMPTELIGEEGELIRQRGHEFGATTGRPRRCGWFDTVAARLSTEVNGFTGAVLTRLDILDCFATIKICIGYQFDGQTLNHFPSNTAILERCQPVYHELPGWQTPIGQLRRFEDLPQPAQNYVTRLEELINCPIDIISVGPRREETITVRAIL
jgi:adenylosuccinate synthase